MKRLLLVAALLFCSIPVEAAWLTGYGKCVRVTVKATGVDENPNVVLFPLNQLPVGAWDTINATDGRDLRVTISDGVTEKAVHLIGFNHGSKIGVIRSVVPSNASLDTEFRIYFDNGSATMPAVTDTYGRNNSYGANVAAAWTLTGSDALTDATGNGYNLTAANAPTSGAAGPVGGLESYDLNGTNQFLYRDAAPLTATPVTLEAFFSADNVTARMWVMGIAASANSNNVMSFDLRGDAAGDRVEAFFRDSAATDSTPSGSDAYVASTWYHGAATRTGTGSGTTTSYLNGGNTGTDSTTLSTFSSNRVGIGALYRNTTSFYFDGKISYPIIHSVARSQNYLATTRRMLISPTSVFSVGTVESAPASGETEWVNFDVAASTTPGDTNWSNPDNAKAGTGSYATANVPDGDTTYTLKLTDASASLSEVTGTINGIKIELTAIGESGGSKELYDYNIQLIKGGTLSGTNKKMGPQWTAVSPPREYGGSTDLWGLTLTDSDVKASNFGIALQFESLGDSVGTMSVAQARLKVYYGAAAPSNTTNFFRFAR